MYKSTRNRADPSLLYPLHQKSQEVLHFYVIFIFFIIIVIIYKYSFVYGKKKEI